MQNASRGAPTNVISVKLSSTPVVYAPVREGGFGWRPMNVKKETGPTLDHANSQGWLNVLQETAYQYLGTRERTAGVMFDLQKGPLDEGTGMGVGRLFLL
jgi:hypothetical protein